MNTRMDKYVSTEGAKTRTKRNENLYNEVLDMSIDYVNIDVNNAVELTPNHSNKTTRENYQKERELNKILPKNEADCLNVTLTYRGGNPEPSFYDKLWKEPWFTVDQISAKDYLESDLYEFYIDIFAYDYRVEKLTQKEKEHMMDSFDELEEAIRKTYGEKVKYEIYFDHEHSKEQ